MSSLWQFSSRSKRVSELFHQSGLSVNCVQGMEV